jgi:hypothetical protein
MVSQFRLPLSVPPATTYLEDSIRKSRYRSVHVLSEDLPDGWLSRRAHSLHTLVPRLGGFPPSMARWAILEYSCPGQTVLDPFCGKGTAPLEALLTERRAIGSDAAQDAFVITHAKLSGISHERATRFLRAVDFTRQADLQSVPENVRLFFSDETLRQILVLRRAIFDTLGIQPGHVESLSGQVLSTKRKTALYVLACLLGCLHGPVDWSRNRGGATESQNSGSLYLSIHCNHTYSASPTYVRGFCARYGLTTPIRNVSASLLRKSALAQADGLPGGSGKAFCRRAELLRLRDRADLVVTSPPYFRAQTYAWDNWLRLWCLGYPDYRIVGRNLLHTDSIARYYAGMKSSLERIKSLLRGPGSRAIIVIGDVRTRTKGTASFLQDDARRTRYILNDSSKGHMINTSEIVCDIATNFGFEIELIINDSIPRRERALASFLTQHHGTDVDRAVILRYR